MNELMRRRRALMAAKKSILPPGYQQIEYVENVSNGTTLLGSSKMIPIGSTIITRLEIAEMPSGIQVPFDAKTTSGYHLYAVAVPALDGVLRATFYNVNVDLLPFDSLYGIPVTVTTKFAKSALSVTAETATESKNKSASISTTLGVKDICIFSRDRAYYFVGKIYGITVKDSIGSVLLDFVPCKRASDGRAGFYETVGGVFYTNTHGSNYAAGPNVQ